MAMKTKVVINNAQKALLHVARARLGLSEEDYRDLLKAFGEGAKSSKELNPGQFRELMEHLKKLGFKQQERPRRVSSPEIGLAPEEKRGFLYAVDTTLEVLGLSWKYADGIAKRMFGVERLVWATPDQIHKVLMAFTYRKQKKAQEGGAGR